MTTRIMYFARSFIVLLFVLSFIFGCSISKTKKQSPDLSSVTTNKVYQVRARTGNLALDKIAFEFAHEAFGKYLITSRKGPYTGYMDITFASNLHAPVKWPSIINWSSPFKWTSPGYKTNVAYGNVWYTGNDKIGKKGISQFTNTEINEGGVLTWHNGIMTVTLRDADMKKLWSSEYTYKGSWNPTRIAYIATADGAVKNSLVAILKQFESDYILEPIAKKKAEEEAAEAAEAAGIILEKEKPKIALYKKSATPEEPEKELRLATARWKFLGNTKRGLPVHIDKTTIFYPDPYVVQLWTTTIKDNKKYLKLYEVQCLENEFRISNNTYSRPSLDRVKFNKWETVFPETTPELIYKTVCPKNVRLQKHLLAKDSPEPKNYMLKVVTAVKKDEQPETGHADNKSVDSPGKLKTHESGEIIQQVNAPAAKKYVSPIIASLAKDIKLPVPAEVTEMEAADQKEVSSGESTESEATEEPAEKSGKASDDKEVTPRVISLKKILETPAPEEAIQMDPKRWKYVGNNQEGLPVHIDKMTISYPAAYVVNLWAATIQNNQKKLNIYEIRCVENEFRIIDETPEKTSSFFFRSEAWETITPESTSSLIYDSICPSKKRPEAQKTVKPVKIDPDDSKRWKLLGRNEKGFQVQIDKTTITYPAAYVVKLWSKTVINNNNQLNLYEIKCLENNFRILDKSSDESSPAPAGSERWQIISPESTSELIYNNVCPKKIRLHQKIAQR